ncbi:hypothetical protein KKG81_11535 [bacterium]|nr:hypothetical protein [bacterium]
MIVSNNTLLNILLPNDNKVLKEVLKEADTKSLEQMIKNNSTSVNDVLKELFDNLKNGTKSNTAIENVLKNSTVFKEMGSVSNALGTLIDNISQDENLQKFKPLIESFLKNIQEMDANTLKEQISKSGVFLESKMAQTPNTKIENILNQIQNLIKDINIPQAKEVNELINKLIQNPTSPESANTLKSLTSALQNLNNSLTTPQTQNLSTLTNQLKSMINEGSLIESKIENNVPATKETITTQAKELLSQIKNELVQNPTLQNKTILPLIDNLLKMDNLFLKGENIQNSLTSALQNLNNSLTSPQTQNLSTLTNQLKNMINEGNFIESKIENNIPSKETITTQVKELLTQIKSDLVQNPVLQNKNIMPLLENLLKMDNLFVKGENAPSLLTQNNISTFTNNFASNLNPLLTSLKESLESINPNNANLQSHVLKLVDKVENLIKDLANPKTNISDDMKSVLLQMQDELASKGDAKSLDISKQIDKLLTQIDYYQLASLASNSNNVYLPFFWEMLEDGNITMKQTEEDKFYCQINLTLKDFGKVDLMLGLYDKNKLDLTIYAQREHFKTAIRDNMQKLKVALNSVELIPVNIKLLDLKEENQSSEKPAQVYMNNRYNQTTINSGIDIRA